MSVQGRAEGDALKVLFFTTTLGGGGAEKHVLRIANHLDPDAFSSTVGVVRLGGSYEPSLSKSVPLVPMRVAPLKSRTVELMSCVPKLRRWIQKSQPDVVCSFMDLPNLATLLATRRMRRAPKVAVCVQVAPKQAHPTGPVTPLISQTYRHADRVIAIAHGVRRELEELDPRLSQNTEVVHNAIIDAELMDAASRPVERGEGPVLVACGRFTRQKGFCYLLEALAKVRQRVPATLWLLGQGPLQQDLERQATLLGIRDSVQFLGFQDEPGRYFAAADVFVLSSIFEGFGMVVAESMACGTPVVTTACPHGPDEIITHEENGLLVPVADPTALAENILRMLEEQDLYDRLKEAGALRSQAFASERIAAEYGEIFQRMVC